MSMVTRLQKQIFDATLYIYIFSRLQSNVGQLSLIYTERNKTKIVWAPNLEYLCSVEDLECMQCLHLIKSNLFGTSPYQSFFVSFSLFYMSEMSFFQKGSGPSSTFLLRLRKALGSVGLIFFHHISDLIFSSR